MIELGILIFGLIIGFLLGISCVVPSDDKKDVRHFIPERRHDCYHHDRCSMEGGYLDVDGFVRCKCKRK